MLSRCSLLVLALAPLGFAALPAPPHIDPLEIINRSIAANEADWRAEANYDHCEHDDDGGSVKTYDVTMIEGTPYERLVAIDGRALAVDARHDEQRKIARAMAERRDESPSDHAQRLAEDPGKPRAHAGAVRPACRRLRLHAERNASCRGPPGVRHHGDAEGALSAADARCQGADGHDCRVLRRRDERSMDEGDGAGHARGLTRRPAGARAAGHRHHSRESAGGCRRLADETPKDPIQQPTAVFRAAPNL